jgi:hypothetical protein
MSKQHVVKAWKDMETKLHFKHHHQMLVTGHSNTPAILFPGKSPQYPHWIESWKQKITVSFRNETMAIQLGTSPHYPDFPNL